MLYQPTDYYVGMKNDAVALYVLTWEDGYNKVLSGKYKLQNRIYGLITFQ